MDLIQLSNLSVVAEGTVLRTRDAGVDIASSLASIFGVDRLESAAAELERIASRIGRETDQRRKAMRSVPGSVNSQLYAEIEQRVVSADEALTRLRRRYREIAEIESHRHTWRAFREEQRLHQLAMETWKGQVDATWQRIAAAGLQPSGQTDAGLAEIESSILALRDAAVSEDARLKAQMESARRALSELQSGTAVCPTCLRPLSSADADRARMQHEETVARVSAAMKGAPLRISRLADIQRDLGITMRARPQASPRPPDVPDVPPDLAAAEELDALRSEIDRTERDQANANAERAVLVRQQEDRAAESVLANELEAGYRAVERALVAATTTRTLAEQVSAERIAPLTAEVEKRWPDLWSGETLSMAGSGNLALSSAGGTVPFSEFSGGQRTIAQVLVRLLTLQMATTCPFLVLDEPLEHLDSTHRRSLATLLVKATQRDTPLRQILVTTYEETVTRRLSSSPLPASVGVAAHVQYVRSTSAEIV